MIGCNVILWPIPWSQCKHDRCTRWWRTPVDWSAHCPCPAVSAISGILLPHHLSNINLQCFTGTVRAQSYLWHRRSLLGFSLLPKFCRLLQQISNMLGGTTWISATNKMLSKFCKPFFISTCDDSLPICDLRKSSTASAFREKWQCRERYVLTVVASNEAAVCLHTEAPPYGLQTLIPCHTLISSFPFGSRGSLLATTSFEYLLIKVYV